jgi:protein SCO1/2
MAAAGAGVVLYVQNLKKEKNKIVEKERTRSLGKAALGGPFSLVDHNGKRRTDKDFHGSWILLYFGFTFCPDICPDELEKMSQVVTSIDDTDGIPDIQPLFITVDPNRDTPEVIKKYLSEFHPKFIGLTGTSEEIHQAAKGYRVYFSPSTADEDNDYIVDHTIIMYLVDPKGDFVDYYGQNKTAVEIKASIANHMLKYNRS